MHRYVKSSSASDPPFKANALLYAQPGDVFTGFAESDEDGYYTLYNVPAGDYKIAVTHPDYPDETNWSAQFTVSADTTVPDIYMGGNLVADFGSDGIGADGTWQYDGTSWTKLTASDPQDLVAWGSNLVADFGLGDGGVDGIYVYDGTSWSRISASDPEDMIVW